MAEERLQKILARAGIASRRKAESLIKAGRVRVDGRVVTELGSKANPRRCSIELDGKKLEPDPLCYGILHKPRTMLTTLSDPEGRPTAQDILRQVGIRVVPIGRLDFNTSGALLFTNDGDFAQALQHARGNVPKVYAAKIQRPVDEKVLEKWAESIEIGGKKTRPAHVRILRREGVKTWLEVTIKEGKKHQIRELGEHAGTPVIRLARLSHAGITTDTLRPGEWRMLTLDELKALKNSYGVPEKLKGMLQAKPKGPRKTDTGVRGRPSSKKPHWSTQPTGRKPSATNQSSQSVDDKQRSGGEGSSPHRRGGRSTDERMPQAADPPARTGRPQRGRVTPARRARGSSPRPQKRR